MTFHEMLRDRRQALGLRIHQVARCVPMSVQHLSMIESGKRGASEDIVDKLLTILDTPDGAFGLACERALLRETGRAPRLLAYVERLEQTR